MSTSENNALISEKVKRIYAITAELEALYPGRHFTPDGHMVGSIGEVLVAENYGLQLLPASHETHHAVVPDGRYVQIKATQINRIAISSEPDYLIVIKLLPDGSIVRRMLQRKRCHSMERRWSHSEEWPAQYFPS